MGIFLRSCDSGGWKERKVEREKEQKVLCAVLAISQCRQTGKRGQLKTLLRICSWLRCVGLKQRIWIARIGG